MITWTILVQLTTSLANTFLPNRNLLSILCTANNCTISGTAHAIFQVKSKSYNSLYMLRVHVCPFRIFSGRSWFWEALQNIVEVGWGWDCLSLVLLDQPANTHCLHWSNCGAISADFPATPGRFRRTHHHHAFIAPPHFSP